MTVSHPKVIFEGERSLELAGPLALKLMPLLPGAGHDFYITFTTRPGDTGAFYKKDRRRIIDIYASLHGITPAADFRTVAGAELNPDEIVTMAAVLRQKLHEASLEARSGLDYTIDELNALTRMHLSSNTAQSLDPRLVAEM